MERYMSKYEKVRNALVLEGVFKEGANCHILGEEVGIDFLLHIASSRGDSMAITLSLLGEDGCKKYLEEEFKKYLLTLI